MLDILLELRPIFIDEKGAAADIRLVGAVIFAAIFVAEAPGLAAGRAAPRGSSGMRRFAWRGVRRCRRAARGSGTSAKADDELVSGHPSIDPYRRARPESQIDVTPRHGRIAPGSRNRACDDPRVRMPFDDFAFGLQGGVIKRVRELAQAAARRWNQAPLLEHPAGENRAVGSRVRFASRS
jgi:hypothetical protein